MSMYKEKEAAFDRIFETINESEDEDRDKTISTRDNSFVNINEEDDDEPQILESSSPEVIEDYAIRLEDDCNLRDVVSLSDDEEDGESNENEDEGDIECYSSEFITFTLQDGNRKNTREIQFSKNDKMLKWKQKYADELNYKVENIRLCFDGDVIDDDATPEEADLENGFRIDVHLKIST